jgi:magnesium chelatase family protein
LDRIDIQLTVKRVSVAELRLAADGGRLSSTVARERVLAARAAAARRLEGTPWHLNSEVPGPWLRGADTRLGGRVTAMLDRALERGGITMRGYDRILRVAWSIADLAGVARPGPDEVGQALYLRKGMTS